MNMQFKLNVNVLSATRGVMDGGQKYASIIVAQPPVDTQNPNQRGVDVMKMSCEYGFLDTYKGPLPADLVLTGVMKRAGGGKSQPHIIAGEADTRPVTGASKAEK